MKILYLYAELMGYQIPVLQEFTTDYDAEVHVVHWDKKKYTPYLPPYSKNIFYYNRSSFNNDTLLTFIEKIKPDIIYVSGWMDKGYIKVCGNAKKKGIPVVAGSDTQYRGDIRQKIGRLYFKLILKKNFSYIWVAGPYQFEYARKLGFSKNEIIFNSLSADTTLFNFDINNLQHREKTFLFVGRFEEVKGLNVLLKAWNQIQDKKGWTLTLIGNGSQGEELKKNKNITVKHFMQPEELVGEFNKAGCFVLPSLYEPWALVIHEAAASGLPIIATNVCGAAPVFITSNYNGYICPPNNAVSLAKRMQQIMDLSPEDLKKFSNRSFEKSKSISPKIVAANFISVLND